MSTRRAAKPSETKSVSVDRQAIVTSIARQHRNQALDAAEEAATDATIQAQRIEELYRLLDETCSEESRTRLEADDGFAAWRARA